MSEISTLVKDKLLSSAELNNNDSVLNMDLDVNSISSQRINESASLSSDSSNNSDISDDAAFVGEEVKVDESDVVEENVSKKPNMRKLRSMSDGQASSLLKSDIEIFPSLPDSVLEKLGLYGDGERERLNEDELEQKFVALSLAFSIDAATIKDRCERQKRYRDQTEINLNVEITKLIDKITQIQPLSADTEKAEHLAGSLTQIDVVTRASSMASISAERFGAVQHEARLAEAVNLMISYVTLLKQQRDSTRKQLQYTKKVLQDTNTTEVTNVKRINVAVNGRLLTKRRASIATIAQDSSKSSTPNSSDSKKLTRRTSDISARVSAFARSSRPSRLELGVDLDKIKEGIVDDNSATDHFESSDVDEEICSKDIKQHVKTVDSTSTPLMGFVVCHIKKLHEYVRERTRIYAENGVFHDCFYITAFVCFMIGFLLLAIFLIDIQLIGVDNNSKSRHHKDEFKTKIKL